MTASITSPSHSASSDGVSSPYKILPLCENLNNPTQNREDDFLVQTLVAKIRNIIPIREHVFMENIESLTIVDFCNDSSHKRIVTLIRSTGYEDDDDTV